MKRFFALGLLMLAAGLCFTAVPAQAIDLFDGKVVIHGKISEQLLMRADDTQSYEAYDYEIFNARSTLKLETMWHAYEGPEYQVNFYGVWKEFYDAAHTIDGDYNRYLTDWASEGNNRAVKQLRSYTEFKDICRELYAELNGPMFQVRLGKQIVSWGETGFERMADVINPVDLRGNLNPAYPDFAEIKRGLWMGRFFFTPPDQPMDLTYELIVIPDFEPNRLWPAGYHLTHQQALNVFAYPDENFLPYYRDDEHNDGFDQLEIGGRIRGFLAGFDWTLQYFHHRADDPVLKTGKAIPSGLGPLLGNSRLGRALGTYPGKDLYTYKWQDTTAVTFNRPIDYTIPIIPGTSLAMSGNVLRFEGIWEHNKPGVEILSGASSRITKQNRYAFCLGWASKIFLPYITPWARNKYLTSETQLFMEFMPEKHRNDYYFPWVTYGKNHTTWTVVTQSLSYELWNGRILPGFYGAWYTNQGGGYWAPALGFKPTFGWTFLVRYLDYCGLTKDLNNKDTWTFEVTYEF